MFIQSLRAYQPHTQTPPNNSLPKHDEPPNSNPRYAMQNLSTHSLEIRRSQRLHHTSTLREPRPENPIRVHEHTIFQTDNNKLTALKPGLDEATDVLGMRKIEGGVDFVEDIHGCWLELQESHDEGDGDEGALATGELGEGLFPDFA